MADDNAANEVSHAEGAGQTGANKGLPLQGARILVVEDARTLRHVVMKILTDLGADVDEAGDGDEALAVLRTAAFNGLFHHLIITDLRMPNMDGYELLTRVRMDTGLRTIPVIVLTADSDEKMILQCAKQGIASYITKPAKPTAVLEAAVRALEQSKHGHCEPALPPVLEAELKSAAVNAARDAIARGDSASASPESDPVVEAVFGWIESKKSGMRQAG